MEYQKLIKVAIHCNKFLYAMNWYASNETPALKDEVDKAAKNLGSLFNAQDAEKKESLAAHNAHWCATNQKLKAVIKEQSALLEAVEPSGYDSVYLKMDYDDWMSRAEALAEMSFKSSGDYKC